MDEFQWYFSQSLISLTKVSFSGFPLPWALRGIIVTISDVPSQTSIRFNMLFSSNIRRRGGIGYWKHVVRSWLEYPWQFHWQSGRGDDPRDRRRWRNVFACPIVSVFVKYSDWYVAWPCRGWCRTMACRRATPLRTSLHVPYTEIGLKLISEVPQIMAERQTGPRSDRQPAAHPCRNTTEIVQKKRLLEVMFRLVLTVGLAKIRVQGKRTEWIWAIIRNFEMFPLSTISIEDILHIYNLMR